MIKSNRLWDNAVTKKQEVRVRIHHPDDSRGVTCDCEKGTKGTLCHHRLAIFSILGYNIGDTDITGTSQEADLVTYQVHLTEYEFGEINHR